MQDVARTMVPSFLERCFLWAQIGCPLLLPTATLKKIGDRLGRLDRIERLGCLDRFVRPDLCVYGDSIRIARGAWHLRRPRWSPVNLAAFSHSSDDYLTPDNEPEIIMKPHWCGHQFGNHGQEEERTRWNTDSMLEDAFIATKIKRRL